MGVLIGSLLGGAALTLFNSRDKQLRELLHLLLPSAPGQRLAWGVIFASWSGIFLLGFFLSSHLGFIAYIFLLILVAVGFLYLQDFLLKRARLAAGGAHSPAVEGEGA